MDLSLRRFSWLWFKDRDKNQVPNKSSVNPPSPWALALRGNPSSPSSNTKTKQRKSREDADKRIDEYNLVLVPSDGGYGYDSDGSDWSIGWLEPHASEFAGDEEDDGADHSFAVLVPCYRHSHRQEMEENLQQVPRVDFLSLPSDDSSGAKYHMERWLTFVDGSH